jgi:hypothetical protein
MKTTFPILALFAASLVFTGVSASSAFAQDKRQRAQSATPIPSCKDMDKKSQAYKDCIAERSKANATTKERKKQG